MCVLISKKFEQIIPQLSAHRPSSPDQDRDNDGADLLFTLLASYLHLAVFLLNCCSQFREMMTMQSLGSISPANHSSSSPSPSLHAFTHLSESPNPSGATWDWWRPHCSTVSLRFRAPEGFKLAIKFFLPLLRCSVAVPGRQYLPVVRKTKQNNNKNRKPWRLLAGLAINERHQQPAKTFR